MSTQTSQFIIENIPAQIRDDFESLCSKNNLSMNDELINYMMARGGNLDALKSQIQSLLIQLERLTTDNHLLESLKDITNIYETAFLWQYGEVDE